MHYMMDASIEGHKCKKTDEEQQEGCVSLDASAEKLMSPTEYIVIELQNNNYSINNQLDKRHKRLLATEEKLGTKPKHTRQNSFSAKLIVHCVNIDISGSHPCSDVPAC